MLDLVENTQFTFMTECFEENTALTNSQGHGPDSVRGKEAHAESV